MVKKSIFIRDVSEVNDFDDEIPLNSFVPMVMVMEVKDFEININPFNVKNLSMLDVYDIVVVVNVVNHDDDKVMIVL